MTRAEWLEQRRHRLGGSEVWALVSDDPMDLVRLYEQKRGTIPPDDLEWELPAQIGIATEQTNIRFLAHATGHNVEWLDHETGLRIGSEPWIACTLDGWDHDDDHHVQCKHVIQFKRMADAYREHYAQVQWEMMVCERDACKLSVFIGTTTHEWLTVEADALYQAELLFRAKRFWASVQAGALADPLPAVIAPVPPSEWRTEDMSRSNSWPVFAATWLVNRHAAKAFDASCEGLKSLVKHDVGIAHGHGVQIKKSKNGAMRISEFGEGASE